VDVGACIGYYTLLAAKQVGPSGKVYAFEPAPTNYELLLKNISLNGYRNVITVQKAISNMTGYTKLYLSDENIGWHSIYPKGKVSSQEVIVETTTLDDYFESQGWPDIHLIKMDIEGAEAMALKGMRRLCKNLKLIVEFNPAALQAAGANPNEFLDELKMLGFTIRVISDKGLFPLPTVSNNDRRCEKVNLYCYA